MERKSISQKIFMIVLGGSFVGSLFVGGLVYFMLASSNVQDALVKAVISVIISQIMFLIPVFGIKKIIDDKIVSKLKTVVNGMHEVSMGNLDYEIYVEKTGDELEELAESFDRMRMSIKAIMEKLEKGEL
ncbi:methyl-accepting chemotaxis sensory transducer [Sulfurihydrogenibium azorense Az-Fu1]|uniref:Methyl-accepting chemotaxis sensory transducer n=1 Tax=Sulfurihydrogenibium azorense (strain DSM 15241 / OCM 825 / Az-Fu1) TaxID=204536 RepID=C1DWI7_SULAA|nr:HAMP domain-containing protein [Sulfurihydrogenibium azorense]ACN99278.1 methyl-accepting chemotaxis sensory transducer [Sulfurihydrogenibium azorense Az-Fu1]